MIQEKFQNWKKSSKEDYERKKDKFKTILELKEEGQGIYEGAMYKANVIVSNRSTVDFKQVFAECSVPSEVIARNTKAQEIITVKITSR